MACLLSALFFDQETNDFLAVFMFSKKPEFHVAHSLFFVLESFDTMLCHKLFSFWHCVFWYAHKRWHKFRQIDGPEPFTLKCLESLDRYFLD